MRLALLSFEFNPNWFHITSDVLLDLEAEFSGKMTIDNLSTGQMSFLKQFITGQYTTAEFQDGDVMITPGNPYVLNWTAQGLIIKNTDATNNLTVSWTPINQFTDVTVLTLTPGALIGFLGPPVVQGTGLTVISDTVPTQMSYVVFGKVVAQGSVSPVLTISKNHVGNFVQGGTGSYTVTVTNTGTVPTVGLVTVTETAPSGLTLTSMSGTGWTIAGNLATRSDILNPGNSYPPITINVSVANNASSPQVNTSCVSGGGLNTPVCTTDSTVVTAPPLPCETVTADQAVASPFGGFTGLNTAKYTVISNAFPAGIPVQVTGTSRNSGEFNISGFTGVGSSTLVMIPNVPSLSVIANGSDSGMICPLISLNQPFMNLTAADQECGFGSSPITFFLTFSVSPANPIYVGQLMTYCAFFLGASSYGSITSITDSSSNTWTALAPAIQFVTNDGFFASMQVFWTLNQLFVNSGLWHFNANFTGGGAGSGAESTLNSWNNVGTLIGSPTSNMVNNLATTLPLSLTTSQNAVVLAFPMGQEITTPPSSFASANVNFGADQFTWFNPSTFSLIAPAGTYSPIFNLTTSPASRGAAGFMAAFTPHL